MDKLQERYKKGEKLTLLCITEITPEYTDTHAIKDFIFYNLVKEKLVPEFDWDNLTHNFQDILDKSIETSNNLTEGKISKEDITDFIIKEKENVEKFLIGDSSPGLMDEKDVFFDFNKIPADNLIAKYIKYCCEIQDAYPEYHFANILSVLSYVVPAYQHPSFGYVYNNLWFVALGIAGFSGKTTTTDIPKNDLFPILNSIRPIKKMSSKPTPEAFITNMSGEGNNKQYWLVDEAAGIMKFMGKDYASELEEIILQVYSHSDISRSTMKAGIVVINNPHIPMLWFTTIDNFVSKAKKDKYESGFFQRPMYLLPKRLKEIKEDRQSTPEQDKMLQNIQSHIGNLYSLSTDYIKFEENTILNKWKYDQRLKIHLIKGDVKRGARTRSYEHVRKLAMLLTIGSQEFLDNLKIVKSNKKDGQQAAFHNYIPDWAALLAIEYVEKFMENFDRIYKLSMSDNGSHISTILKILSENDYATRTQLTSSINRYGRGFDDVILDLLNDGIIEMIQQKEKKRGRPEVIYKLFEREKITN